MHTNDHIRRLKNSCNVDLTISHIRAERPEAFLTDEQLEARIFMVKPKGDVPHAGYIFEEMEKLD